MPKYTTKFKVPKHLVVPDGAVIPSPKGENEGMITGNWRIFRPVIDHEKCTTCMNCYIYCPDACWHLDEKTEKMVWNAKYCKGCLICVNECPAECLTPQHELDFEDGVVRLDVPF